MAVSILKQADVLIASIQAALSDRDLDLFKDELANRVGRFRARGVVIDVTALDVLDSFATRTIRGIAHTARLRGAETIVVGIQPEVAIAMVRVLASSAWAYSLSLRLLRRYTCPSATEGVE